MEQLNTHIAYLPLAYQCAIETITSHGERTDARMQDLCDFYATSYGLVNEPMHKQWSYDALCIARRRVHGTWIDYAFGQ